MWGYYDCEIEKWFPKLGLGPLMSVVEHKILRRFVEIKWTLSWLPVAYLNLTVTKIKKKKL